MYKAYTYHHDEPFYQSLLLPLGVAMGFLGGVVFNDIPSGIFVGFGIGFLLYLSIIFSHK